MVNLNERNCRVSEVMCKSVLNKLGLAPELLPKATEIAEHILGNAPLAVRGTKRAVMKGLNVGLADALHMGWYMLRDVWGTEDFEEGPRAFTKKRTPEWTGASQRRDCSKL